MSQQKEIPVQPVNKPILYSSFKEADRALGLQQADRRSVADVEVASSAPPNAISWVTAWPGPFTMNASDPTWD